MNHLWPLITHSSPSWYGVGLDERRVGAGHLGLGHREARRMAVPSHSGRRYFSFCSSVRPVQQRVHVALVGRLAVEHERADTYALAASACTIASSTWPEPHAAPLLRHVRQPESPVVVRLLPQLHDRVDHRAALVLVGGVPCGPNPRVDELANLEAHLVHLGREREVDHPPSVTAPPPHGERVNFLRRLPARSSHVRQRDVASTGMSTSNAAARWDRETLPEGEEKVQAVREMFDAIAPRYDLVNRIMTFRLDVRWRRKTVRDLALPARSVVLDLASGTGDLCVDLREAGLIADLGRPQPRHAARRPQRRAPRPRPTSCACPCPTVRSTA